MGAHIFGADNHVVSNDNNNTNNADTNHMCNDAGDIDKNKPAGARILGAASHHSASSFCMLCYIMLHYIRLYYIILDHVILYYSRFCYML